MSQIRPESLHIAPLDDLPEGTTAEVLANARYVRIERFEDLEDLEDRGEARPGGVLVECQPDLVGTVAEDGWLVVVCPDEMGARPGGPLEAVVTRAVVDGARIIRSEHHLEVRRCLHVAAALLTERRGVRT